MIEITDRLSLCALTDSRNDFYDLYGRIVSPGELVKKSWFSPAKNVDHLSQVGIVIAVFDDFEHETLRAAVLWSAKDSLT